MRARSVQSPVRRTHHLAQRSLQQKYRAKRGNHDDAHVGAVLRAARMVPFRSASLIMEPPFLQRWSRAIDMAWAREALPWRTAALAGTVFSLLFAGSLWVASAVRQQQQSLQKSLLQASTSAPARSIESTAAHRDFTSTLGTAIPAAQLVASLQHASVAAGVTLASVQAQARDATADQLGRLELSVVLHGPYLGTKLVLKEVTERFPGLTVQRLRIRRAAPATHVETHINLTHWSSPLTDARAPSAPHARER